MEGAADNDIVPNIQWSDEADHWPSAGSQIDQISPSHGAGKHPEFDPAEPCFNRPWIRSVHRIAWQAEKLFQAKTTAKGSHQHTDSGRSAVVVRLLANVCQLDHRTVSPRPS